MSGFRSVATLPAYVLASLVLMFSTQVVPAFAQGSTGGTLGKTDQSLSGGSAKAPQGKAEREAPRAGGANQAKSQGAGLCGRVAGNWKYTSIGSYDVTLHPNGTGTSSSGQTAAWTCSNGRATVTWSAGFVDNLKVMPDGNHLLGSNSLGGISVTRR